MGLVAAKCPCCGANIEIPDDRDRTYCSYCGTQILTEAATAFARVKVEGVVETRNADFIVKAGTLFEYNGFATDIVIPSGVKRISSRVFWLSGLTSVVIPEGVVAIESEAFFGCSDMTRLELPSSLEIIEGSAFSGCHGLTQIDFPKGLKEARIDAFAACSSLTQLTLPAGCEFWAGCFRSCYNLKRVYIEDGATAIERRCFADCPTLESVSLPASIQIIDRGAFEGCTSLSEIEFRGNNADQVEYVDDWAKGTPMQEAYEKKMRARYEAEARALREERMRKGVCLNCGGEFTGFISKKCSSCGRSKDY